MGYGNGMRNPFRHRRSETAPGRTEAPAEHGHEAEREPARGESTMTRSEPARTEGPRAGRAEGREVPAARRRETPEGGRRGIGWRGRNAGAATVGAVGSGVLLIARLVMTIAGLIALLIALAIVLRLVDANTSNAVVEGIHEGANFFAGAFTGLIIFSGRPKLELTVDWGIALIVYLIVGAVIAGAIRSVGMGGVRFEQRHRPASL